VASFLAVTARASGARFLVELGTNIGYGAIVLARAAGPSGRVVTIEMSTELVELARGYIAEAGLAERIEVRHGAAMAELEKIQEPIDLIYIDCVKEEYPRYLELAVPRLAPRGVLVADNVMWRGHVAHETVPEAQRERTEALRAFNLAVVQHPQLRGVILPLGDGVAYAVKIA
jgi:predicted O-methyltransferase YrrM